MILVAAVVVGLAADSTEVDWRHIDNGAVIPSQGYADQPYIVVARDGAWVCTLTTGPGHEGDTRQHVVSSRSTDRGKTWSPLVDIEPEGPPEASWVMPLIVPSGRIYVFYVYNADNLREVKGTKNRTFKRVDTLGAYMMKYSDDNGTTWSEERYEVPIRTFQCDRDNVYGGEVKFFWGVGKPILHGGVAYIGLAKVGAFGDGFLEKSEGIFLRSDNIATEPDPAKITWETLPDGDVGLRAPAGPISEEHNLVPLSDGTLYCTYRTTDGSPCHAYSHDGGHTWSGPEYMTYAPGGRQVKHPRAANFVWRCSNGKFLYWFHNHGGRSYNDRNPAWISGGVEIDGRIHWAQPEILLYADEPTLRMSYPNLIEQDGAFYITETQKTVARIHPIDVSLLKGLWNQHTAAEVARNGLALEAGGDGCAANASAEMPRLPRLSERGGFSLDLWVDLETLSPGQVLLDSRTEAGAGIALATTDRQSVEVVFNDGTLEARWDCDTGILAEKQWHHITATVDGGPQIVTFVVDGTLCDGGADRSQGWARFDAGIDDVNGAARVVFAPSLKGKLDHVRIYGRALRTSEAIGNWRAGR